MVHKLESEKPNNIIKSKDMQGIDISKEVSCDAKAIIKRNYSETPK